MKRKSRVKKGCTAFILEPDLVTAIRNVKFETGQSLTWLVNRAVREKFLPKTLVGVQCNSHAANKGA